jgi:hypothetical protein
MIRAWLVQDAAARRWAEGILDDDELLAATPLPGQDAALYAAWVVGRRELVRILRLCLRQGWGLACVDRAGHYAPWRWEVANGPARYVSAAMMLREGPKQPWAQGTS